MTRKDDFSRSPDLAGQRFGALVALRRDGRDSSNSSVWLCQCDCGGTTRARSSILKAGLTKACGSAVHYKRRPALQTELGKALYPRWRALVERTTKAYSLAWDNYGGRGIDVCERWSGPDGLENFIADMGATFSVGMTVDRIDNDKGYSPENCRWATPAEQARNRRSTVRLTYRGRTLSATEWALELGLPPKAIQARMRRGWSVERALTTPLPKRYDSEGVAA